MREKGRKYDTWSQKDTYIAAAITWLIKYNRRLWYINMNSRSVYPLLSDVIMNSYKCCTCYRLHFCLICSFLNFQFVLFLKVNQKHTCMVANCSFEPVYQFLLWKTREMIFFFFIIHFLIIYSHLLQFPVPFINERSTKTYVCSASCFS